MSHLHNIHFLFDEASGEIIGFVSPETGRELLGNIGAATGIAFTTVIPLRYTRADMGIHWVNGQPLHFTADIVGAARGNVTAVGLVSDGINVPTFSGLVESSWSDGYVNGGTIAAGVLNALYVWFDGLKVNYAWTHEMNPTLVNNPFIDLIPPGFLSGHVRNDSPTIVRVTMDEPLFGPLPSTSAFVASGGRVVVNIGSGGVGIINLLVDSPYVFGEEITLSYTKPFANPLRDAAGNETLDFGPVPIGNEVEFVQPDEDLFLFDSTVIHFDTLLQTFDEDRP